MKSEYFIFETPKPKQEEYKQVFQKKDTIEMATIIPRRTESTESGTTHRDNADDVLPYTVTVSSEDKDEQIKNVSKELCPFLRDFPNDKLSVKPLTGGLSNELFVVSSACNQSSGKRKCVLVRLHPSNINAENTIVDRDVENNVCAWLSSQHVGPIYYGRFRNGRVEEYYPNHISLSYKEMPLVGPSHIAPIMAHFHSLQIPRHLLTYKSSAIMNSMQSTERGDIFVRAQTWLNMAENLTNAENQKAVDMLNRLKKDWSWLQDALHEAPNSEEPSSSTLAKTFLRQNVFAHMDMQSQNLLRNANQKIDPESSPPMALDCPLQVIDFEYAGFNPRAVDMANTFCEHCNMNNIKADYEAEYPSVEVQNAFLKSYIQQTLVYTQDSSNLNYLKESIDDLDFLAAARHEIGRYTLVSHISWAIWSIVQSTLSDIDFDYIKYAQHRMDGFEYMKGRFSLCS